MNQVVLVGRLTADPDLRYLPGTGTPVAKFKIAIDRSYKKNNQAVTDFIPIEVWGKVAEFCANYLEKGRLVAINGSLHIDRYVDEQGVNRTYAKVSAKTVQALGSSRNKNNSSDTSPSASAEGFQEVLDDDDLPF